MAKRKKKRTKPQRDGLVYFDPVRMERRALSLGLCKTALADEANVSRSTVYKASRGKGIFPSSALLIAKALGLRVEELLSASELTGEAGEKKAVVVGEWRLADYLTPWITASNGLQFRICDMRHLFVDNRRGRGKWYDLVGREREQWQTHLVRHASVCERIGAHRNIAENLNTLPGSKDGVWWVIDRWVPGQTLCELIDAGGIAQDKLPQLMREIAEGLAALHAAKVVFRELAPCRVIVADDGDRAVLTDFELAKLTDAPTVSKDWPEDPYQAPEVRSGTADERSDLYSWARILLHAAAGELPAKGCEADLLNRVVLPKKVWQVVSQCLSPVPSDRPRDVEVVLSEIRRWK